MDKIERKWHVTRAKYIPQKNAVSEKRIRDYATYAAGMAYLKRHITEPIYMWHHDCHARIHPMPAIVETEAYRKEHKKVID